MEKQNSHPQTILVKSNSSLPENVKTAFTITSPSHSDRDIAKTLREERKAVVDEFVSSTTLHGLNRILSSRNRIKRMIWLLLVLLGVGYLSYASCKTIYEYHLYPYNTKVQMVFEKRTVFPAVTICNTNRFMRTKAEKKYPRVAMYYKGQINATDVNIDSSQMEQVYWDLGHQLQNTLIGCKWSGRNCFGNNFSVQIVQRMGLCYTFNSGKCYYSNST